jgi:hypothetical protein
MLIIGIAARQGMTTSLADDPRQSSPRSQGTRRLAGPCSTSRTAGLPFEMITVGAAATNSALQPFTLISSFTPAGLVIFGAKHLFVAAICGWTSRAVDPGPVAGGAIRQMFGAK